MPHPKEDLYKEQIRQGYEKALAVQAEKMKLTEKALELVKRYEKRLVGKMKALHRDGLLAEDPSPVPGGTTGGQVAGVGTPSTTIKLGSVSERGTGRTPLPLLTPIITAATPTPTPAGGLAGQALKRRVTLNNASTPARSATPTPATATSTRKASEDPALPSTSSRARSGSVSARGTPAPPGKTLKRTLSSAPPSRKGTVGSRKRLKKPPVASDGLESSTIILGDGTGTQTVEEEDEGADDRKYCFCKQVSWGDMVGCDNEECRYEWFHWSCVGIEKEPVGKWYCEECRVALGK